MVPPPPPPPRLSEERGVNGHDFTKERLKVMEKNVSRKNERSDTNDAHLISPKHLITDPPRSQSFDPTRGANRKNLYKGMRQEWTMVQPEPHSNPTARLLIEREESKQKVAQATANDPLTTVTL